MRESSKSTAWVTVLVALIGLVGALVAGVFSYEGGERRAVERAIEATLTAEAKLATPTRIVTSEPPPAGALPPTSTSTFTPLPPTPTPTLTPTPTTAANMQSFSIEVLGSADQGVEWCTNAAGEHIVRYVRGAYSPFPTNEGCDPKGCWKGAVFVYKNATADGIFADEPKGEPVGPLFIVGWNDWLPSAAEVESKQLEGRAIQLDRGDCLRFITVDARDAYHWPADNRGAVQLEVLAPDSGMCFGMCWRVDDAARTLTWTGPTDGSEDIWLGSGAYLQKVQAGYAAILENSVPLKVDICVGQIDGQVVAANCTPTVVDLTPGKHTILSAGSQGGFRAGVNLGGAGAGGGDATQDSPEDVGGSIPGCGTALSEDETRIVEAGTFIVGDVVINDIRQHDVRVRENTVAYFETPASVYAQWGAACYRGSADLMPQLIADQFSNGCQPDDGCTKVRVVYVRADGAQEAYCQYPDGTTQPLQRTDAESWCP